MNETNMAASVVNTVITFISFVSAVIYSGQGSYFIQKLNELLYWKSGCNPLYSVGNVSLHYFAGRGRAEAIRLLMEDNHIVYTEQIFDKNTWPEAKAAGIEAGVFTFGQVPAIVTSKKRELVQSKVILHYLGRSVGLDCDCRDLETCDMIAGGAEDLYQKLNKYLYNPDFSLQMRNEYVERVLREWFSYFETLAPNAGPYFAGDRLTWIDYLMFDLIDSNCNFINYTNQNTLLQGDIFECSDFLKKYPSLRQFYKTFGSRKNIVTYLESDRRPSYGIPYPMKIN